MGNNICTNQNDSYSLDDNNQSINHREKRRLSKQGSPYDEIIKNHVNILTPPRLSINSISSRTGKKSKANVLSVKLYCEYIKQFPIQVNRLTNIFQVDIPKTVFKKIENLQDLIIKQILPPHYQFDLFNNDQLVFAEDEIQNYVDNEENIMEFQIRLRYKMGITLKEQSCKLEYISVQSIQDYDQNTCQLNQFYFKIAKSIVSMINRKGGIILIGVNPDSCMVEGIENVADIHEQIFQLQEYLFTHIQPNVKSQLEFQYNQFQYQQTTYVIEIQIPNLHKSSDKYASSQQIYSLDYICYFKQENSQIVIFEPDQYIDRYKQINVKKESLEI